jgi:hypothetical protein
MKTTLAIEFILTPKTAMDAGSLQALRVEGPAQRQFRIVLDPVTDVEVFWRDGNNLGEEIWRGGHNDTGAPPTVGGLFVDRKRVIALAMRRLIFMLATNNAPKPKARELPNGAVVFDLGTL